MGSPEDANGNFSSIGDQDFLEWTCMTGLLTPKRLDAVRWEVSDMVSREQLHSRIGVAWSPREAGGTGS